MKRRFFLIFVIALLFAEACSATRIHGIVYDETLTPVNDCVVEVDSVPLQRLISKDGSYSFNLNPGVYVITAKYGDMTAKESISIQDESGDYVIDLFLFPTFEEEEDLLNETNINIDSPYFNKPFPYWIIIVVVVALVFIGWLFYRKRSKIVKEEYKEKKPELEKEDIEGVVNFIKQEGGRVTQKDIRKKFPLSEAKISLMISELEHKGLVEKIKKGRGNIIVLKK